MQPGRLTTFLPLWCSIAELRRALREAEDGSPAAGLAALRAETAAAEHEAAAAETRMLDALAAMAAEETAWQLQRMEAGLGPTSAAVAASASASASAVVGSRHSTAMAPARSATGLFDQPPASVRMSGCH